MNDTYKGPDGKPRCRWCAAAPGFPDYHDKEWGYPVDDDIRLFEKLCLESFQSGLSWRTILAKCENFRNEKSGIFGSLSCCRSQFTLNPTDSWKETLDDRPAFSA